MTTDWKARAEQAEATIADMVAAAEEVARRTPSPFADNVLWAVREVARLRVALAAAGPSAPEPDSITWDAIPGLRDGITPEDVVAWVNANGGEARYFPGPEMGNADGEFPRIEIRTGPPRNLVYAKPGDTVQMTDEWFNVQVSAEQGFTCRVFRVVSEPSGSPATDDEIEQRFQAARHEAHERS